MEVQLLAATKAKLVRQVLVQNERGFTQVLRDLAEWQTPVSMTISSFCSNVPFLQGYGGERFFSIQLFCQLLVYLGPYPFIILALGALRVRTCPCCYPRRWGRLPSALTVYGSISEY